MGKEGRENSVELIIFLHSFPDQPTKISESGAKFAPIRDLSSLKTRLLLSEEISLPA